MLCGWPEQFVLRIAGNCQESLIGVGDMPFQIGFADDDFFLGEETLNAGRNDGRFAHVFSPKRPKIVWCAGFSDP